MKSRWIVGLILAAFVLSSSPVAMAAEGDKIVRTKSLTSLPVIKTVCAILGIEFLGALDTPPGSTASSSLFLVRGLLNNTVNFVLSLLGLAAIEEDLTVTIAESDDAWGNNQATATVLDQATATVLDQLWDRTSMSYYGSTAWQSYLRQPAAGIIRLRDAHCDLRSTGAGLVAVIDTGVDTTHPTLAPFLVPGYDFTRNSAGGDEKNDLGQATATVLDGTNWVNRGTVAGVDQATATVLDTDPDRAAFGHGTMVAGLIHLTAPTAKILPVKAFRSNGQANTSDILRAIYYSVNKGAKVLNMSFSRSTPSLEMKIALDYATLRGVLPVASAGNAGNSQLRYPAAYDNALGVAATTNADVRSSYSSYGSRLVFISAPGDGVITTYPMGTFAATWGTSFSTPLVAGTAALLVGIQGNASPSQVTSALSHAKPLTVDLGKGRLDVYQAVAAGRAMWPWGASSAVPASCGVGDVDWTEAP